MDKEIGSLEDNKRADMIMVRIDRPNAVPLYDAVSQMVYALKASDVRDVMVNGKPVVRDAKILTLKVESTAPVPLPTPGLWGDPALVK